MRESEWPGVSFLCEFGDFNGDLLPSPRLHHITLDQSFMTPSLALKKDRKPKSQMPPVACLPTGHSLAPECTSANCSVRSVGWIAHKQNLQNSHLLLLLLQGGLQSFAAYPTLI